MPIRAVAGQAVYPKFVETEHQTCLAHLLRRCREVREVTWGLVLPAPSRDRRDS